MNAEIIAIGTELLLGEITDTNSTRIARAFREIGLDLWWISAVGDNEARIAEAVDRARRRSAVVLTSGGLGPTVDDPTRTAVARAFGVPLEFRPELWQQIEARFVRYGRKPTENNRKQAYVPAGAIAWENPVGTAPCFVVEHEGGVVISLPGVPRELEYMLEHVVVPYLVRRFNLAACIRARVLRTVGIGESLIDARIGDLETLSNPTVGLAAHAGQTDIRITAKAATPAEAEALIVPIEADIRQRLGDFIYGEGQVTVEEVTARLLAERGQTLAVAEAGTHGHLAERLRGVPDAARVLVRATQADEGAPDGDAALADGAALARQMAAAARTGNPSPADWGLGVVVERDPHRLHIALASAEAIEAHTHLFGGHPELLSRWAATTAVNMLRLRLLRQTSGG